MDFVAFPQYQTVLFALHPPSIKEPFITVSHRSLAEDDRKYLAALEPRIKLLNLAGEVLHISHPTRAVDIISEVGLGALEVVLLMLLTELCRM